MTTSMRCFDRREFLKREAHGFGWLALAALFGETMVGRLGRCDDAGNERGRVSSRLHHVPKAKNVIFLFMDGGPSQVDTFDPKPRLQAEHGKPFRVKVDATQFDNNGTAFGSPYQFQKYGESGIVMSEIFPHLSKCADDLCVIRSMTAEFPEHSQACYFLHSGHPLQGRPSLGAWIDYGLGSPNDNLPGFVVLNGGVLPIGGVENFSSAFLPANHQGLFFDVYSGGEVVTNIKPIDSAERQKAKLELISQSDNHFRRQLPESGTTIDAAIKNYETAFSMQTAVPELIDLSGETADTLSAYGVDSKNPITAQYARECLLARRLVERGVRFVELTCVRGLRFVAPWDDHEDLEGGHRKNADAVDQPISALIQDLKARGLFHETLLIFAGEFGRTPFAQGSKGRDHNPQGFSIWLAGGGIKGGVTYGATDEFGYRAVDNQVTVHDLHATILHLLGIDHERLTFRWGGRDFRLTDVYGNVLHDLM